MINLSKLFITEDIAIKLVNLTFSTNAYFKLYLYIIQYPVCVCVWFDGIHVSSRLWPRPEHNCARAAPFLIWHTPSNHLPHQSSHTSTGICLPTCHQCGKNSNYLHCVCSRSFKLYWMDPGCGGECWVQLTSSINFRSTCQWSGQIISWLGMKPCVWQQEGEGGHFLRCEQSLLDTWTPRTPYLCKI